MYRLLTVVAILGLYLQPTSAAWQTTNCTTFSHNGKDLFVTDEATCRTACEGMGHTEYKGRLPDYKKKCEGSECQCLIGENSYAGVCRDSTYCNGGNNIVFSGAILASCLVYLFM